MQDNDRSQQLAEIQRDIEEERRQARLEQLLERQMERNAGYYE